MTVFVSLRGAQPFALSVAAAETKATKQPRYERERASFKDRARAARARPLARGLAGRARAGLARAHRRNAAGGERVRHGHTGNRARSGAQSRARSHERRAAASTARPAD